MTTIKYTTEYEKQLVTEIHRIVKENPEKASGEQYSPKDLLLVIFPQREELELMDNEEIGSMKVDEEWPTFDSDKKEAAYQYYGKLQLAAFTTAQKNRSELRYEDKSGEAYSIDSSYLKSFKEHLQNWTGPFYNYTLGKQFDRRLVANIYTTIADAEAFNDNGLDFERIEYSVAQSGDFVQGYPFYAKGLLGLGLVVSCGLLITVNEVVKAYQERPLKGFVDLGCALMGGGAGFALSYFLALGAIGLTLSTLGGALLIFASTAIGSAVCSFAFNKASDKYIYRPTEEERDRDADPYPDLDHFNTVNITQYCQLIHSKYTFFWTEAGETQTALKREVQNARTPKHFL